MVSLYRFLLAGIVVCWARVDARAVNKEAYDELMFGNFPEFLQELKGAEWGNLLARDRYPDDEYYPYADAVPAKLREVPGFAAHNDVIGQVGGVAVDGDDNLVVFHRADRKWEADSFSWDNVFRADLGPISSDVISTLDPVSGQEVSSFGAGKFLMPHGLTIDREGNVWVTDVGLHQVIKFPKGSNNASLVLGEERKPGSDDTHFCKPTDVAVASNGEFFVSDGYCNSRILKFSKDGKLITQWGRQHIDGASWEPDMFRIPHSLALDESRDSLCVADRENGRIQCFSAGLQAGTQAGTFQKSFRPNRGAIYAIEYEPFADVLYAVNGPGYSDVEGFTLDMDGTLLESWTPDGQQFGQPHDVTVSHGGSDVYVGDIGDTGKHSKVWQFVRM